MGQRLPAGSESVATLIRQRREQRDTRTAQTRNHMDNARPPSRLGTSRLKPSSPPSADYDTSGDSAFRLFCSRLNEVCTLECMIRELSNFNASWATRDHVTIARGSTASSSVQTTNV